MKQFCNRILAYTFILALLLGMVPLGASAAAYGYMAVDYGNNLPFDTQYSFPFSAKTPKITLPEYNNYTGYALGGSISCKQGMGYTLSFEVSQGDVDVAYYDAGFFVFSPHLTGDFQTDLVGNRMIQEDYNYTQSRELIFTAPADGEYKVLVTANMRDQLWKERFSPDATYTLNVREHQPYHVEDSTLQEATPVTTAQEFLGALQEWETAKPQRATLSLEGDIDLRGISYSSANLEKTFLEIEGNGHKILGISAPLMSVVRQVRAYNLTLDLEMHYKGNGTDNCSTVGGMAGSVLLYANLENCHVTGNIVVEHYQTAESIGGLVGCYEGVAHNGFSMDTISSGVNITIKNVNAVKGVGGVMGYNYWGERAFVDNGALAVTIVLENCQTVQCVGELVGENYYTLRCGSIETHGSITLRSVNNAQKIGGVTGVVDFFGEFIDVSSNTTIVAPTATQVGGILGYGKTDMTFKNSSFEGELTAKELVGGIVGMLETNEEKYPAALNGCVFSGKVTAQNKGAGICANMNLGTLTECTACGTVVTEDEGAQLVIGSAQTTTVTQCVASKNSSVPALSGGVSGGVTLQDFNKTYTLLSPGKPYTVTPKSTMNKVEFGTPHNCRGYETLFTLSLTAGKEYLLSHLWLLTKGFAHQVTMTVTDPKGKKVEFYTNICHESVSAMDGENGDPKQSTLLLTPKISGNYTLQLLTICNQTDWSNSDFETAHFGKEATSHVTLFELPKTPVVVNVATKKDLQNINKTVNGLSNPLWVKINIQKDLDMKGVNYTPLNLPITKNGFLYRLEVDGGGKKISKLNNPFACYAQKVEMRDVDVDLAVDDCPKSLLPTYKHACSVGGLISLCEDGVFENCDISGYMTEPEGFRFENSGGLVGSSTGFLRVENCQVNLQVTANVNNVSAVGGVVGWCRGGSIGNTRVNFGFTVPEAFHGVSTVGGLLGYNSMEPLVIENCRVKATVNTNAHQLSSLIGGVAGSLDNATVTQTYATVSLTVKDEFYANFIGGFAGRIESECTLKNCYVKGRVQGTGNIGGFTSILERESSLFNCYTTVDVVGETKLAGFVAEVKKKGTLANCYAAGDIFVVKNSDVVNVLVSSFSGSVESVWTDSAVAFENCYAKAGKFPPCLDKDGPAQGVTMVDFSKEQQVAQMEQELNEYAAKNGLLPYLTRNEKNAPTFTPLLGDVNGDYEVNAKDALEILKYAVEKVSFSQTQMVAAKVDADDAINAKDALEVLKYAVGKILRFPIEG